MVGGKGKCADPVVFGQSGEREGGGEGWGGRSGMPGGVCGVGGGLVCSVRWRCFAAVGKWSREAECGVGAAFYVCSILKIGLILKT